MAGMKWCKQQKKGIKLISPNNNLAKEYMQTSEETLETLKSIKNKSRIWLAATKYYCEYFAVYSLLMKTGIKSEIHECTIAISRLLEKNKIMPSGYTTILEKDKNLRIDNQYYLKNKDVQINHNDLLKFILTIKDINNKLTNDKIKNIRNIISSA